MNILSKFYESPWFILLGIVIFFGIIALIVFLLRKKLNFTKTEKPKDEHKIAEENLKTFLEDVEDPEMQKQFEEYEKSLNKEKNEDEKGNK